MFNPDLPVTKLPVFRAVLILGGALTVGTTVAIGYHTNLSLCFTATCFNNLLEFFKVPIRLLAATLSIIGLIALAHRSEQSAKQIKLSENQNRFTNYYKHLEEFEKYIEKDEKISSHIKSHPLGIMARDLHELFFPKLKHENNFYVEPLLCDETRDELIVFLNHTSKFYESDEKNSHAELNAFNTYASNFKRLGKISALSSRYIHSITHTLRLGDPLINIERLIDELIDTLDIYIKISSFEAKGEQILNYLYLVNTLRVPPGLKRNKEQIKEALEYLESSSFTFNLDG